MISASGATIRYPDGEVGPFDLSIGPGERVLVSGPSGGGKSSLVRRLAGLESGGGTVRIDGRAVDALGPAERRRALAFVAQEPVDQVLAATALGELLAGGCQHPDQILAQHGLPGALDLTVASGGTIQRVVIAAALAGDAGILLLDEPLAWLDAEAATALLDLLQTLADGGVTVVLVEHRVDAARRWATREIEVVGGRISRDGPPLPTTVVPPPLPTVGALVRRWDVPEIILDGRRILSPVKLAVHAGERVAVMGRNAAGKSSLLRALAGDGAILVPQDPDLSLFCRTVADELDYAELEARRPTTGRERASHLDLPPDRSPQALSRGQRLRLAIGAVLAAEPVVLLLDEPTAGQDAASVVRLFDAMGDRAVVFATHDAALAAAAHRIWWVDGGRVMDGAPGAGTAAVQPLRSPGADPRRDVGLVFAVGCLAVLLERPLALLVLAAVPLGAVVVAAPRWRRVALLTALAFAWSAALSQGLFYAGVPRTPLVTAGPVVIWAEGVGWGLAQGLRAIATTAAGMALVARHPGDRIGAALARLGVPAGLAFLAMVSLRALPGFGAEIAQVREARARRGRPIGDRGPLARLALEVDLLRPIVARTLRRARTLGDSLLVRGIDPADPPQLPPGPRLPAKDRAVLAGVAAFVLGVAALKAITAVYLADVAYVPAWRGLYAWTRAWL